MKTQYQIISIAFAGLLLASCSSSKNLSKSSVSSTDDIYYTPSKIEAVQTSSNTPNTEIKEVDDSNLANLEKKYSKVLSSDTTNIDTLIYKDKSSNPYDNILSDSYQESYERRLRGIEDPKYGMNNYSAYYSNDYWYASAYDPYFYNVVVMGNQVWVEPWYISNMFYWPHNYFSFGIGFGYGYWNWSPWYSNYYYPYNYYGWNYPYYWENYYTNVNYNNGNYYYGPRSGGLTTNTSPRFRKDNSIENQIITSRRRGDITTRGNNTITTTRTGQRNGNQEIISRGTRENDFTTTRLRGNSGSTRNTSLTEPTRRNNNTYQRPRTTNGDGYIRTGTRNQNTGSTSRETTTRGNSTTREGRNTTPTYNKPNRVDTSTERTRTSNTGSSSRETNYRNSGGSNSSSGSSTRSSSGSSSNQNSSSGGSTRRR